MLKVAQLEAPSQPNCQLPTPSLRLVVYDDTEGADDLDCPPQMVTPADIGGNSRSRRRPNALHTVSWDLEKVDQVTPPSSAGGDSSSAGEPSRVGLERSVMALLGELLEEVKGCHSHLREMRSSGLPSAMPSSLARSTLSSMNTTFTTASSFECRTPTEASLKKAARASRFLTFMDREGEGGNHEAVAAPASDGTASGSMEGRLRISNRSLTDVIRHRSGQERVKLQNWSARTGSSVYMHCNLPPEFPGAVKAVFAFCGIIAPSNFDSGPVRMLYKIYRYVVLPIVLCSTVGLYTANLYCGAAPLCDEIPEVDPMAVFALVGILACILPLIWTLSTELSPGGSTMRLLHHAEKRFYDWSRARWNAYTTLVIMFVAAAYGLNLVFMGHSASVERWPSALARLRPIEVIRTVALPFTLLLWPLVGGLVCIPAVLADFHCHELFWYATGLTESLECDEDVLSTDLIPALKQTETIITDRLRQASLTWVRRYLFTLVFLISFFVIIVTYALMATDVALLWRLTTYTVGTVVAIGAILWPIARVAEVFDHDVLRELNNPVVMQNAQRCFGQQFLPHITTLAWGFRMGGRVIDMRFVMQISMAAMLSTITSLVRLARSEISL